MATPEDTPGAFSDNESGAVMGLSALDRANRAGLMLDGLSAMTNILDVALTSQGERLTAKAISPALYLMGMIAADAKFEVDAMWEQVRDRMTNREAA